ncbi:uncharacterized protein LOC143212828 isoform X2 [Lasioglossum baleicum]|uniref:uncharacterized protein LOC143212828 isoform X2 n=1 Tax=Lasioglossum baleicum TaxID=434251 RepID=UPI003FCD2F47
MRNNSTGTVMRRRGLDAISFASATKIVIAVNKVTGLRPLRHSDAKFWIFLNYSYRMIVVSTLGYGMYWIYMYRLLKVDFKVDRVVYLSLRIVNYLCFICILILGCYHSDGIPELRRRIADLEESLTKLGAVVNNRKILLWIIGTYGATILNASIMLVVYGTWPLQYTLYHLFFGYITNIGSQVVLDFLTYACWLKCSFKQTNELLKKFLVEGRQIKTGDLSNDTNEADRRNVQKYLNKWMPDHSLRRIRVAPLNKIPSVKHELQAVKKVHMLQEIRAFDAQIMVYSFVIVLNIVAVLYYLYTELRRLKDDASELHAISVPVLDILYTSTKIVVVCYVCEDTVKEMKKVVEIIHECSISDFDVELKDEILQFSLQLSLNDVCSTKSDFFRLNFSFMRQCISSITTYLVIMIQWAQSINL